MPVIGFLHSSSLEPFAARIAAFHQGLGEAALLKVAMWRLSIAGRMVSMTACQR
jgi:hypothetical protein